MTKFEKIIYEFVNLVEEAGKYLPPQKKISCVYFTSIRFQQLECQTMEETFKREFIRSGLTARLIKYTFGYEIRYLRNGFHRVVFHENLAEAKKLFASL